MDQIELKACPFCAGPGLLMVHEGVFVRCAYCGCMTPVMEDQSWLWVQDGESAIKKVIELWNHRPEKKAGED